jgi:hypothetical protein
MASERTEPPFLYDAFISYRHVARDRKWAEWLISALEGYRTPATLQKLGVAPRLRKIFRDEDEVPASGDLNDQIRQALVASRFLIVVCSPYTPRSAWVQREIEMFNELDRGDDVLALLTEGEPSDSFPAPILERLRHVVDPDGATRIVKEAKEPLAADVRPRPGVSTANLKHMALLRLVAVILRVKYDDLYQRERQRVRARRTTWAAVAAVLVVAIVGGGLGYWQVSRPKVAYFRDLVFRWEIPEGVGPVDEATRAHSSASFRVVTEHGKVVEVRHENSDGSLVPTNIVISTLGGIARWVVGYRADGSLESVEMSDATERVIYDETCERDPATGHLVVNLKNGTIPIAQEAVTKSLFSESGSSASTGNTEITRQELTFDANGFVYEVRYQNYLGTPRQDVDGSYGERYARSPTGLPTRRAKIGPDGSEITLKDGWRARIYSYDGDNRLIRMGDLGADEKPIDGSGGVATISGEYDSNGNVTTEHDFAADGAPAQVKGACATVLIEYDERGRLAENACLGADGKPTLTTQGYARFVRRYGVRSDEVTYYGIDGEPILGPEGCARVSRGFDERGHAVRQDCQTADGNPDLDKFGRWRFTSSYDPSGNQIEISAFGLDGRPTLSALDLCARTTAEFDARGNQTSGRCYGADGNRMLDKEGVSETRFDYDPLGNNVATHYLGIDGKPTIKIGCGCSGITGLWDRNGSLTERTFVGVDGKPSLNSSGFARAAFRYDDRGNWTEAQYFDSDDELALNKSGYAKFTRAFDPRGHVLHVSYFGADSRLTLVEGVASRDYAYDASGNRTAATNFGLDGKPTLDREGCAKTASAYDLRSNRIEESCFGVDGLPTLRKTRSARDTFVFDAEGRMVEFAHFGADGQPALVDGVAKVRKVYGLQGKVTETSYLGRDGAPSLNKDGYAKLTSVYDSRGNDIEDSYFGIDGRLAPNKKRYAILRRKYDERDKWVEESSFGPDEKPALNSEGFAKVVRGYDARGNVTVLAWFGADGEPVSIGGRAREVGIFDARGHAVEAEFFGVDGRPVANENGEAKIAWRFDERGNMIEADFFGVDGRPAASHKRVAILKNEFDERDKLRRARFFGPDGKPVASDDNVAQIAVAFDARGNEIERDFFGVDGNPTLAKDGAASLRKKFDDRGQLVEESFFGLDGAPIVAHAGYARVTYLYDPRGEQIERAFIGPDGKAMGNPLGFSRVTTSYDDWGEVFEERYLDPVGREIPVGVTVTQVLPDSFAQRMQFAVGDRLLTYAGRKITSVTQFVALVQDPWLSETRILTVSRGSQVLTFQAPAGRIGIALKLALADAPVAANPQ